MGKSQNDPLKPRKRAGETFGGGANPKFSTNFKEILSRAHGNFEEQNTVLESSTIMIN
jgi:hypothetical protein